MPDVVPLLSRIQSLRQSSVLRYGLTNLLPRSVAILSTVIITPLAISRLGVLEYGLWALAALIPNLVSSPDFGITYGVVNVMARIHGEEGTLRHQRDRLVGLFRLLLYIALGWTVVGSGLLAWYVFSTPQPGLPAAQTYLVLFTALVVFALGIAPSLWSRVQLAQERGHESLMWEGVGKLVSFGASLAVLFFWPDLLLLVVVTLLPTVVTSLINAHRYLGDLGPPQGPKWSLARTVEENREIFRASKYYFVFQVTFLLGTAVDPFLVNGLLSTRDAAYLTLIRRPFDVLPFAVTLFSTALWPVFYRLNASNQVRQLQGLLGKIVGGSAGMLLTLSVGIIALAGPLYGFLSQGKLTIDAGDLVWIALQTTAVTVIIVFNNYLSAVDLLSAQMWVQIVASLVGLAAKVVALQHYGLHAYIQVAALTYVVFALLPMAWLTFNHLRRRRATLPV